MNKLSVTAFKEVFEKNPSLLLIDVRSPEEFGLGHIPGAKSFPLNAILSDPLSAAAELKMLNAKNEAIYLVCLSDRRSYMAASMLTQAGIENVCFIEGGTQAWVQQGYDVI